jgi:adenosyl cobinamide kinase/adenosyl cobinamide phosphate guanylyltransferase
MDDWFPTFRAAQSSLQGQKFFTENSTLENETIIISRNVGHGVIPQNNGDLGLFTCFLGEENYLFFFF